MNTINKTSKKIPKGNKNTPLKKNPTPPPKKNQTKQKHCPIYINLVKPQIIVVVISLFRIINFVKGFKEINNFAYCFIPCNNSLN